MSISSPLGYTLAALTEQDARQVQWQAELKGEDWSRLDTDLWPRL
jgi:hypothetical protein